MGALRALLTEMTRHAPAVCQKLHAVVSQRLSIFCICICIATTPTARAAAARASGEQIQAVFEAAARANWLLDGRASGLCEVAARTSTCVTHYCVGLTAPGFTQVHVEWPVIKFRVATAKPVVRGAVFGLLGPVYWSNSARAVNV